jgi:uncharacterized protein (TIRG00374 family)
LKKHQWITGLVVLAALAALVIWGRNRIHFDFAVFRAQIANADWRRIALSIACIYSAFIFRSARWALLMRHNRKTPPFSLMGSQIIGFTGVALFGRFADLMRPYLIAKKTGTPLTGQIAVYIVERIFDGMAMAVLLAVSILFIPAGTLPNPGAVNRVKFWFLFITFMGALFVLAVRLAGKAIAAFFEAGIGLLSKKFGHAVGQKIRVFRTGLDTIRTFSDFGMAAGFSLVMWFLILLGYMETENAFVANPQLASMTLAKSMVVLACSGGASFFQLPVLGWFTQIGAVGEAIHGLFAVEREAAWACSAMLLVDTFLSVLPLGLVWAQIEHVSLRATATESEQVDTELATED